MGLPLITGTNAGETLDGTGADEILAGDDGADTLNGNGGDDLLLGGDGVDTLFGGMGDDILDGGQGDDEVTGGPGADIINVGSSVNVVPPDPNLSSSQDTVFYTDILDVGDIIHNFDADSTSTGSDIIDLDGLLDSLSVADVDRPGVIEITALMSGTQEVRLNNDGNPDFEVLIVTVNLTDGTLDVGTDVLLGMA